MPNIVYNWKRYWCPREGALNLSDGGYLVDPEGEYGRFLSRDVRQSADLAATPCLVLLGEPGSGKTTALEEIALSETAAYKAIRLDLGEYSSEDRLFRRLFENATVHAWLHGAHFLSVLLDGLDECRVTGIAKVLSRELTRLPTERMRLRIACRTAEWPVTLEETLRTAWGKENVGVYELAPLSKANVIEAATRCGLSADAFIAEVARVRAQPLAIKPVSLKFLLNQYQASNRLPADEASLYMQGCYCLCEDSQERQDAGIRHASDAPHRFAIAQRIAYATIFSGKCAVWTGAQDGSMPAEDLPLLDLLGTDLCNRLEFEVNEAVLRDTLNTGLFTARGAHRMGWAHQTYAEFLASQYVLSRLGAKQRRSLLLLADSVGAAVVPQLSEVAARVATSDEPFFRLILKTAPTVLLRSDVATADYAQRAALLSALLSKCAAGDVHFRDLDNTDRLRHLNHPKIGEQLRPFVTSHSFGLHARALALETLEACGIGDLQAELIDLALDTTADIELRCRALGILGQGVNADVAARIRPLAEDSPEDPDSRLKGYVLRALWPRFLPSAELFRLLSPKQRNRTICAYDMFLSSEVVDTLRPQDLPAALAWAQAQGRRSDLDIQFQKLLDGVLIKAWHLIDAPGVLPLLADTLGKRLIVDHGHIMDGTDVHDPSFLSDERKRRDLLAEMVSHVQDVDNGSFYLSSRCANIARPSDFAWLVIRAVSATTEAQAQVWARLCRWNYNLTTVTETESVLSVYHDNAAIHAEFAALLEPIQLDSPQAMNLREEYKKYSGFDMKREEPPLLDPPPAVRVQRLLDRCDAGEPQLWWCVARELTLEPRSTHYNELWEPDIRTLPGWKEADEETRTRIREAAKLYILEGTDRRSEWVNSGSSIMYPANAGYQALRLIHASEPAFIGELPSEAWARWAVALLYHPLNLSREESAQFHASFVKQMFSTAPAAATEALEIIIARQSRHSGHLDVLSRVAHVQCPELATMLKHLVSEKRLATGGAAPVLHYLIAQNGANATAWVMRLLQLPQSPTLPDRDYALDAAEALCSPATSETWPTIWATMTVATEFGHNLVARLASSFRSDIHSLAALTDENLADLYVWVSREFPHREDPDIDGAHAVSKREEISRWRDQYLLPLLKHRGTLSACNAIFKMMEQLPDLSWLRFTWLDAIRTMRSQTWQPLSPSELLHLAARPVARAVTSANDLLDVIQESLQRLQDLLRGQTPMVPLLWDYQRDKKSWCPKDENTFSDFVASHLQRDIRHGGIVVNREVQIRPLRGTEKGQDTDILVEAVILPVSGGTLDVVQVIIEAKGCWHHELNTAMQSQLVDRYLAENHCQHGLYLVGYFLCDSWDDTDYRKQRCKNENKDALAQRLDAQAVTLSQCGRTIVARILDARL